MLRIKTSIHEINLETFKFPAGEIKVSIDPVFLEGKYEVIAKLYDSNDIMELLLFNDILKRLKIAAPKLIIPYLPYGRQDRVTDPYGAFSLKVMAELLNNLYFEEIVTFDCHSPVTNALINNLHEVTQDEIIKRYAPVEFVNNIINQSIIIAPDAGAAKKAYTIASHYKRPFAVAEKIRDIKTGEILHTKIDAGGKCALIMDDICDGGRTFIELTKALRTNGFEKVYLYVTHGIFSKGLGVFDGLIDHIYMTNTFIEQRDDELITTFKVV